MDQEACHLDLPGSIEGHQADVSTGEGLGAGSHLLEDLSTVLAAEHGQLPHGPVTVVEVVGSDGAHAVGAVGGDVGGLGGRELQARGPAIAHDVVHLLGDLSVGESGQEGESLEEPGEKKGTKVRESVSKVGVLRRTGCPGLKIALPARFAIARP